MTRYILDTNIVSDAIKPRPSPPILDWLGKQADEDLFITSFTIAEIWRGIFLAEDGRRKRELQTWFAGHDGPLSLFAGRILPFEERAAMEWARLETEAKLSGRPRGLTDLAIAALALTNDCIVATANERHFEGVVAFFNPLGGARVR